MKPSFALDFRDGVIALLHRTTRGWQTVGASPLDAADLGEALTYLRATALGLSPRGLSTKLVIPNEMVLYTQVYAPGPEPAKRRKQIRAALEGLTPYKAEDLVFDWHGTGPQVQVAVVARETLAEAEAFAVEHRFNPVSFVGAPEQDGFVGEPFFGPSALSTTLLAEGEKVERDQEPVTGLPREFGRVPEDLDLPLPPADPSDAGAPLPDAPPEAAMPVAPEPAAANAAPASPVPASPELASPAAADLTSARPVTGVRPDPVEMAKPEPVMKAEPVVKPEQMANMPVAAPVVGAKPDPVVRPDAVIRSEPVVRPSPLPDFAAVKAPQKGAASFDPAKLRVDLVDEAPMAVDVADDAPPRAAPTPVATRAEPLVKPALLDAKLVDANLDGDLPPSPSSAVIAAFASRRAASLPAADDKSRKQPSVGAAPQQRPSVTRPAMAKPVGQSVNSREAVHFPKVSAGTSKFPLAKSTKPLNAGFPVTTIKRNVVQLPKQPPAEGDAAPATSVKPAVRTVTGLDGRPIMQRGKPRHLGLVLTALLLLALALVAAWSSYFLTSNAADPNAAPATSAVAAATPDTTATPADAVPTAQHEAVADGQDITATSGDAAAAADSPPAAASSDTVAASDAAAPPASADGASADGAAADGAAADAAAADAAPADTVVTPDIAAATDTVVATESAPAAAAPAATTAPPPVATAAAQPIPVQPVPAQPVPAQPVPAQPVVVQPVAAETVAAKPEPAPGTVVTTEAAQASAIGTEPQDEIFLADADTPPQTSDPLALPQLVAGSDPPPEASGPPPPFGTLYTFDAEGRIQPTPEGIITPEGVLLVAGAPKVVPPNRPAALTTPVAAKPPATTDLAATAAPAVTPATADLGSTAGTTPPSSLTAPEPIYADPALAGKRPKPRPAGLVDPASATAKQGEALAPAASSRFAAVRPQVRPAALITPVTQAADAAQQNGAAAASLALNGVKPSALAVAVSKMPAARPSGMNQAVNAAVAAAVRAPEPQAQPQPQPQQQTASAAAEAQSEPEVENVAPALPTNASVAKQATTVDALNLSRVALLGIFGTASGRYAMIRQPTGGVKRVVVGDSIDGGRVAAISENALQYQKGGRMVTLSMPTG